MRVCFDYKFKLVSLSLLRDYISRRILRPGERGGRGLIKLSLKVFKRTKVRQRLDNRRSFVIYFRKDVSVRYYCARFRLDRNFCKCSFRSSERFAKEEILKGKRDVSWIWVLFKLEILKLKSIYEAAVRKGVREQVG